MQESTQDGILPVGGFMPGLTPPLVPDPNFSAMPPIDPAMAQAYMQMFQYLQQGFSQQALGAAALGIPPMPQSSMPIEPSIKVSVEGMKFQYQLTEDDLQKVFGRYGQVKRIAVDEAGSSGMITFTEFQEAQAALNDLNGKVLNGLEGTLRIQWATNAAASPSYVGAMPPFPGWGFPAGSPPTWLPNAAGAGLSLAAGALTQPGGADPKAAHTKGVRKYTCRFMISIENDKEFQVARRIIGAKGVHMKRIVRQTEAKLRLRGKGSGYFEGASQKESLEPLQLCVSCTSADGYKQAVRQVEELLKRVYDEYRDFCKENGRPVPDLQINLSENQLVYSSRSPSTGGAVTDTGEAGGGSPKRESRRSRQSRQKADRVGKTANGEVERGEPGPNAPPVEEIEKLIDDRNEARRASKFPEADRIRDLLHSRGVALMDEPGGRGRGREVTTWRYWRE